MRPQRVPSASPTRPLVLQPLQIKSVVAPEHVKGYIYVEAYKQTHVKQAIEGVGNLRMGYWNQQMVPIKEMTDVLKVVKEVTNLKPKSWVRLKRGIYKDDIAQVRRGRGRHGDDDGGDDTRLTPRLCPPGGLRGAQPESDLPQDDPPHRLRPDQSPHEPGKRIHAAPAPALLPHCRPSLTPCCPPTPQKDWFAKRKKFKRPPQRLFDAEKIR